MLSIQLLKLLTDPSWSVPTVRDLILFDEKRKTFRHIDLKGINHVTVNNIKCIYPDKKGNIWLGTFGEGIFLRKSGESIFHPFILEKSKCL